MYDEVAAKAAYVQQLEDIAATQDLSEDLRASTRNLSIIFTVLAAAFVGLRFTARWRQCVKFGTDDWLILVAMLLLVGNMIMNLECRCCDAYPSPVTYIQSANSHSD
jgi:hypothetical protein